MTTEPTRKPNIFVRVLLIIFSLGLAIMIGYNFFFIQPVGELKGGILTLLGMLLILVLAESFDNFSLGKLISIKRNYETKVSENKALEKRNFELINQLITFSANQNQKQQNTNVFGDYYSEERMNSQSETATINNVQELLDRIGTSIVISDIETRIRTELQTKGLDVTSGTAVVLIRHLAGTQLLLEFERIHSSIFGSQIYLLKELNRSIPNGIGESEVFAHFLNVKQRFPDIFKDWTGDKYLGFLYAKSLILKNLDNNIRITNLGVEYLTWITRNGLREDTGF